MSQAITRVEIVQSKLESYLANASAASQSLSPTAQLSPDSSLTVQQARAALKYTSTHFSIGAAGGYAGEGKNPGASGEANMAVGDKDIQFKAGVKVNPDGSVKLDLGQAIDISNPAKPRQLAELRPEPLAAVSVEDPGLGGNPIEMWSYPVIQDGIIWVVDVRNGLYAVRYTGAFDAEVTSLHFAEGNSNLD